MVVPNASALFGSNAGRFIEMIDELDLSSRKIRYTFTALEEYKRIVDEDLGKGMQIYWGEILARAHLTAVTAILRSRHWIGAVVSAAGSGNCLALAAAFRGLIESAADAATALKFVPLTLARDHSWIVRALSGGLAKTAFLTPEIEDTLIHFSYARHVSRTELETLPRSHKALNVREYIEWSSKRVK